MAARTATKTHSDGVEERVEERCMAALTIAQRAVSRQGPAADL